MYLFYANMHIVIHTFKLHNFVFYATPYLKFHPTSYVLLKGPVAEYNITYFIYLLRFYVFLCRKYKFFFILLFGIVVLMHFMSDVSIFSRKKRYIRTSKFPSVLSLLKSYANCLSLSASLDECLKDRLSAFQTKRGSFDAVVFHEPLLEGERQFLPFVGKLISSF